MEFFKRPLPRDTPSLPPTFPRRRRTHVCGNMRARLASPVHISEVLCGAARFSLSSLLFDWPPLRQRTPSLRMYVDPSIKRMMRDGGARRGPRRDARLSRAVRRPIAFSCAPREGERDSGRQTAAHTWAPFSRGRRHRRADGPLKISCAGRGFDGETARTAVMYRVSMKRSSIDVRSSFMIKGAISTYDLARD